MKKVFLMLFSVLMFFGFSFSASAQQTDNNLNEVDNSALLKDVMKLNKSEIERLKGLGFTEQEIDEMTYDTYRNQDGLQGTVVEEEEKFLRVKENGDVQEISKEQAEKEIKAYKEKKEKMKNSFGIANVDYTDSESLSWMSVTTTVTKYQDQYYRYTGKYRFKHSWNWLTNPAIKSKDAVAITYSPWFTYNANTEYRLYRFDRKWASGNYKDTISLNDYSAEKKDASTGIGFSFDLYGTYGGYDTYNHRGLMYFDTRLANTSYNSGNVYGHYGHTTVNVSSIGINLAKGSFSISGASKVSYMTDTGISFSTK